MGSGCRFYPAGTLTCQQTILQTKELQDRLIGCFLLPAACLLGAARVLESSPARLSLTCGTDRRGPRQTDQGPVGTPWCLVASGPLICCQTPIGKSRGRSTYVPSYIYSTYICVCCVPVRAAVASSPRAIPGPWLLKCESVQDSRYRLVCTELFFARCC